jgi:GcrA cell cycle regulator
MRFASRQRNEDEMGWTDERVELLRKLWMEGLSAAQIAMELGGVTRNAVIGKIHRMGLSGRAKQPSGQSSARPARKPAPQSFQRPAPAARRNGSPASAPAQAGSVVSTPVPDASLVAPEPLKLELVQLTERTCRWPIGDPATEEFHFCGVTPKDGLPYCPYHCRIAYQPVLDRRKRA